MILSHTVPVSWHPRQIPVTRFHQTLPASAPTPSSLYGQTVVIYPLHFVAINTLNQIPPKVVSINDSMPAQTLQYARLIDRFSQQTTIEHFPAKKIGAAVSLSLTPSRDLTRPIALGRENIITGT